MMLVISKRCTKVSWNLVWCQYIYLYLLLFKSAVVILWKKELDEIFNLWWFIQWKCLWTLWNEIIGFVTWIHINKQNCYLRSFRYINVTLSNTHNTRGDVNLVQFSETKTHQHLRAVASVASGYCQLIKNPINMSFGNHRFE